MLQKINFTGRIDLPMDVLESHVEVKENRSTLFLKWDFSGYKFDPSSQVWLEIRRAGSYEYRRELLGAYKKGITEASIDVSNMTDPRNLRLRLKVSLDQGKKKILLGNLDNFVPRVPQDETHQRGFLSILKDESLEVPWIVKFQQGEPLLVISGKKNVFSVLKEHSPTFIPSILPEVVRQICVWAANDKERENPELFEKWERLLVGLGAREDIFEADDTNDEASQDRHQDILENAVNCASEFARKHSLLDQIDRVYSDMQGVING